ncbi:MAG: exostosin family protein [Mucilaginibacter polytrichastri]|nr:exostosin family protein [Mucilaginibacter polytrichastri]
MTALPIKVYHEKPLQKELAFVSKSKVYVRSDLTDCDVIVHYALVRKPRETLDVIAELRGVCHAHKKKAIVFVLSDFEGSYPLCEHIILVRTSARKSLLRRNELILPYLWEGRDEEFMPNADSFLPKVGFCGLVSRHRRKLIEVFRNSSEVRCDLILREKFWGGDPNNSGIVDQFFQNIHDNQYILSNRGAGNFSMRFYQALSCGRIPVVVDTDMRLPFSDSIDWQSCIVFEKDETTCLRSVIARHAEAGTTFRMQEKCVQIYRAYFAEENYFGQLMADIRLKNLLDFSQVHRNKLREMAEDLLFRLFKKTL